MKSIPAWTWLQSYFSHAAFGLLNTVLHYLWGRTTTTTTKGKNIHIKRENEKKKAVRDFFFTELSSLGFAVFFDTKLRDSLLNTKGR